MRGAQIRERGAVPPARGSPRCDVKFLLAAPPCVTKFRKGFCAECITRRISRSLHNSAGAVLRRRRCAAARTQRKFFRLKFVRYAHRQTAGHRHSRAFVSCLQRSVLLRTAGLAIQPQRFPSATFGLALNGRVGDASTAVRPYVYDCHSVTMQQATLRLQVFL